MGSDQIERNRHYGCALLAGGAGRRAGGRNKALLEYEGSSFLERIGQEMASTGYPCYLSTGWYEQAAMPGWTGVQDEEAGDIDTAVFIGPMGGILACLRKARTDGLDGLFFAPCDAPLFRSCVITEMRRCLDGSEDAAIWRTPNGRLQPVFGYYSVTCVPVIEELRRQQCYRLSALLQAVRCRILDTGPEGIPEEYFTNVNRMGEYQDLLGQDDRGGDAV